MADNTAPLESQLLKNLVADWGYVMGSAGLRKALGFSTQQSLRHAIQTGRLPFPVFIIEGRKGPFARTHDVAAWLASQPSTARFTSAAGKIRVDGSERDAIPQPRKPKVR